MLLTSLPKVYTIGNGMARTKFADYLFKRGIIITNPEENTKEFVFSTSWRESKTAQSRQYFLQSA